MASMGLRLSWFSLKLFLMRVFRMMSATGNTLIGRSDLSGKRQQCGARDYFDHWIEMSIQRLNW